MWTDKVRYLFVYLVSSKALSCYYDLIKKSFSRAFNAMETIERLASVDVVVKLSNTKCMPLLFLMIVQLS